MSEGTHSKSGSASSARQEKENKLNRVYADTTSKRSKSTADPKLKNRDGDVAHSKDARVRLPAHMEPTFYIGGGNGVSLVEEICVGLGWKRTTDKKDESYRFKWCEIKGNINYYTFREGDQMVNHIPNCNLLTNKLGLLNSLQEYDRMCQAVRKRAMKLDFIPETFRLDDPRDKNFFRQTYQDGENWICKPTGKNQGKGIFIIKSQEEVNKIFEEQEERVHDGKPLKPLNRIIQRYVGNPLLVNNKKFDIRCYMLVASTVPYLVLYHKGYIRLSIHDYDNNTDNLIAHLTNQYIQKKDPSYKDVKEDTTWSMEKFNDYVNDNYQHTKGIERDWALTALPSRIKQIMTYCFNCVKSRLQCKIGYHDLYGFDFMIDDNMKIWLIEVNVNPCLSINCEALREVIPGVVKDTIHIANECFEKSRKGRALLPLNSIGGFEIIFSHGVKTARKSIVASPYRKDMVSRAAHNPERRASSSPTAVRRPPTVTSSVKEPPIVAPALDANITQVAKPAAQYSMNKPGSLSSKAAGSVRLRNTPTATPTIVTPGSGLPVPQRSVTFAQLKGAGPPSNAASSLKVTISGASTARVSRPPTRQAQSDQASKPTTTAAKESTSTSAKPASTVLTKPSVTPKPSAGLPNSAKSSVTSAKASSTQQSTEKSSAASSKKVTARTSVDMVEPPHHNKIKKELKNKVTASETILIRNITKQNASNRKTAEKQSSRNKRVYTSASEVVPKTSNDNVTSSGAKTDNACSKLSKSNDLIPEVKPEVESELSDDHDDDVSIDSCHDDKDIGFEPQCAVDDAGEDGKNSRDVTQRTCHVVAEPPTKSASDTKSSISKKITLHLSPHGSRGSKDGGKPDASTTRFAAMYPTSPYVDTPASLSAVSTSNATVPQLRMTHNGTLRKPKRVDDVILHNEKPNRGS